MSETNFNFVPNGRRHFEFFESLDALLVEQDEANAELHKIVEQNGTDLTEEEFAAYIDGGIVSYTRGANENNDGDETPEGNAGDNPL
jgi:hypothetical protein